MIGRNKPEADNTPLPTIRSRLSQLLGKRRRTVAALAVLSLISGFVEAAFLATVAQVAAAFVGGGHRIKLHGLPIHGSVNTLLLLAFGLTVFRLVLQLPLSILPARIAADVQAEARTRVFHSFTRASWGVQSDDREGLLQETMTSQVMQATGGALQATSLLNSSITFFVLMISAFALNPPAAGGVLLAAIVIFALLRPLRSLGVRRARSLSQAQLRHAAGVAEANRVAEETQVFGVDREQRSRIDELISTSRGLFFRTQMLIRLIPNLYQSMIYMVIVATLAALESAGRTHAGSIGAVILVLVRAGSNGQGMQSSYQGLSQSLPFIERIQEAEQRYTDSVPVIGDEPLPKVQTLAFENVSFAYRVERPVLKGITFEVNHPESVGIIGPSGAGKSTMIQLLLRLRLAQSGAYLINGLPAEQFRTADWHRLVSYVPQEPRLVHASVAENIRYFRDISDAEVQRAARLARIHDDITAWGDGYDTIVGPRADAVSGGQQQRICLARSLAARPEILVLDEPTSSLDPNSEMLIQESLAGLRSDLSMFIIAHRMSTLDACDRVMVIVDGELVAFDTKAALQESNPYYRSAMQLAPRATEGTLP